MEILDKLIDWLQYKIDEIPKDDWSYETHIWSKGFIKGCEYTLNLVKIFKELMQDE